MINTRQQLIEVLKEERKLYLGDKPSDAIKLCFLNDHNYLIWKYVRALRYTEYYYNCNKKVLYFFAQRKKNRLGAMLGITIWHNTIDAGLKIWHYGSIIVNGHAKIGKNCQLHGDNCIGNKGGESYEAPSIGNNVEIGVGACVIGDIFIADNVRIGANAVVTKSCYTEGATLVGVPSFEV